MKWFDERIGMGADANRKYNKLVKLANQAMTQTGRAGSKALRQLAKKAGHSVESGGKHLTVRNSKGDLVTQIPHSIHGSGTARRIAEAILHSAEL